MMNLPRRIIWFYPIQNNSKIWLLAHKKFNLFVFSTQASDDGCTIHYSFDKEDDIDEDEDEDLNLW